jgi:two-component system response regulator AtoC
MQDIKILIIDDQGLMRMSLERLLTTEGYEVVTAKKAADGIQAYKEEQPTLTLLDMNLPDENGIDVLKKLKEIKSDSPVIMVTAYGDVETAVRAMKKGAYDFIEKPFKSEKLKVIISKALEAVALRSEVAQFRNKLASCYGFNSIIGQSDTMKDVFKLIEKIARSDSTTILLHGESGTGKDMVARVIHYQSRRKNSPFMDINCTALPENLFESELFGYEKGAFTDARAKKEGLFELAHGGTIFLDEIGDMPQGTQAKLLKVIENKTFKRIGGIKDITIDVRIIAATNKDLTTMVENGSFREDLYYRLKVIPVSLPPLRDRKDDIIILAKFFISEFNKEFKKNVQGISKRAEKIFLDYSWPGNVRELKNIIERIMILENTEYIRPEHLPTELSDAISPKGCGIKLPPEGLDLEEVEKELINQSLQMTSWNQTKAARLLCLSRDALRYRMQKFRFLPDNKSKASDNVS